MFSDATWNLQTGEFINVYDEDGAIDVFVIICPANDPITPKVVEAVYKTVKAIITARGLSNEVINDIRTTLNQDPFPFGAEVIGKVNGQYVYGR